MGNVAYYMMNGWDYGMGGSLFGFVFMLLIFAVFIVCIVAALRSFGHNAGHMHHMAEQTPLDVLKYRYARGEIDKKEFEEKKKDLGA